MPTRIRGHWYYGRSFEGKEYGASCRVPVRGPDDWTPPQPAEDCAPDQPALPGEELLLDLDALAEGHEFFSLGGSSVSPDGHLLAYSTDVVGDERYTIRVKDLRDRRAARRRDRRRHRRAPPGTATGDHLYYTTVDDSWRADKIWRHRLGTAQADDELVHHETDGRFWVGVGRTRSDRFLVIASGSKTTTEYRFLDADDPEAGLPGVRRAPRGAGVLPRPRASSAARTSSWCCTTHTGADFELGTAPDRARPRPSEWAPLVPHDPAVRLEDVDAFAGHLVVHQRSERADPAAHPRARRPARPVTDDYLVEFDEEVYTVGSGGNPNFDQPTVRLGYTTMAVPSSVYDYDVRTRELTLLRARARCSAATTRPTTRSTGSGPPPRTASGCRSRSSAGAAPAAPTAEPTPIPVLLYGYGAYETSIDPYFSIARLSLLDRGAGFAIAHVRGGGEMGRRWYDDGKLFRKQNTFSDFVACARHLVETGWTTPERLVAEGASAGGLLMGAVANQAPELFGGVVAGVPFVDALTTMLDATLPLTVTEYDEWGNPEADPAVYDYMRRLRAVRQRGGASTTRRSWPRPRSTTPGCCTSSPPSGSPGCGPRATGRRDFLLRTEMSAGPRRGLRALQVLARPGLLAGLDPRPDGPRRTPPAAPRP